MDEKKIKSYWWLRVLNVFLIVLFPIAICVYILDEMSLTKGILTWLQDVNYIFYGKHWKKLTHKRGNIQIKW